MSPRKRFDDGGGIDCRELILYTGLTGEQMFNNTKVCRLAIAEEWNKLNPQTVEECQKFYETTGWYVYDLYTWAHDPQMWELFDKTITGDETVLDYGCGIGDVSIYLAEKGCNVIAVDLPGSETLKFAMWRVYNRKLGNKIKFSFDPSKDEFDVILAIDVLEHLHFPLRYVINLCNSLKGRQSWFFATPSFFDGGNHPMHLKQNFWLAKSWPEAMASLGFGPEQPIKNYYYLWKPLYLK